MKNIIISTGSALPRQVVTNNELSKSLDTSHDWIVSRTGIHQRHICTEGETTTTLAISAAKDAIKNASIEATEIDMVIVATTTADNTFPSVASQVEAELGIGGDCPSFDIQAACSGFIHGLATADSFINNGKAQTILVIGADTFSNVIDWQDRNSAVLFGDGAAAVIVHQVSDAKANGSGIIGVDIFGNGKFKDLLKSTGGIATTKTAGTLAMNGREVFKHAVNAMRDLVPYMLKKYHMQEDEITWLVPHQANARIIETTAKLLKLPMNKVVLTVDKHANTSAASIPLALDYAVKNGDIKTGDVLFLEAFGAGFAWGAAIVRW